MDFLILALIYTQNQLLLLSAQLVASINFDRKYPSQKISKKTLKILLLLFEIDVIMKKNVI